MGNSPCPEARIRHKRRRELCEGRRESREETVLGAVVGSDRSIEDQPPARELARNRPKKYSDKPQCITVPPDNVDRCFARFSRPKLDAAGGLGVTSIFSALLGEVLVSTTTLGARFASKRT